MVPKTWKPAFGKKIMLNQKDRRRVQFNAIEADFRITPIMGSQRSKIMTVIDSNVLRSGTRTASRCVLSSSRFGK
jgi:hypothetical protein